MTEVDRMAPCEEFWHVARTAPREVDRIVSRPTPRDVLIDRMAPRGEPWHAARSTRVSLLDVIIGN